MKLTKRRVEQLIVKCIPFSTAKKIKPKRGKVDEVEFFLAYIKLIEENHQKAKSNESALEKAQIRLRLAQAQRSELEFEKENQSLVSKEISIKFIANTFGNVRNRLLGSPNRIAFQIFGSKSLTDAKVKTKIIIEEICQELSDPKNLFKESKKSR